MSASKVKILVTGAGALLGQGIIKSLRKSSLDVHIVGVDPSPLSAGLYWCDSAHIVPMANDPSYLDRVTDILAQERPDCVLIGTDVELALFSRERGNLESSFSTRVLVSDPAVIEIADDKFLTYRFLARSGFPCPRTCLPGEEADLVSDVGFPLVVKPRHGARSVGVVVAGNDEQLTRAIETTDDAVIQELVGTDETEYTAGTLRFDGCECLSIVMRRDLRDGNTYRAYVDSSAELNASVREMAEALRSLGPANFQFRVVEGEAKVFEINARFSGTTPQRALAGFNEVELSLRKILFGEEICQPIVSPLVVLRYWDEIALNPNQVICG
jgi:carbamoyl-phosphate synthase large subunit